MRKILVIDYSQTGQTSQIRTNLCKPLVNNSQIEVDFLTLEPEQPFPFPWPFIKFFEIFPETVQMKPIELKPVQLEPPYDLIILCYQVWFLTPSLPISSFLQSQQAKQVFNNTPVVTVIGCRNMWLQAQEKTKKLLHSLGAKLVDNLVLVDKCNSAASFIATPLWMLTGKKQAWRWVPKAGIAAEEIVQTTRFGEVIAQRLIQDQLPIEEAMLKGLGAVKVNEKLIASEHIGNRSFQIWSRLLLKLGPAGSLGRRLGLAVYVVFLIAMILTVVPVSALIKLLLKPLLKNRLTNAKNYFAEPSGEATSKLMQETK